MRIGDTCRNYVAAFGKSTALAAGDEVQRAGEAHGAVDDPVLHESRSPHGVLASRTTSFSPIIFQP